jgi:2-iminobutanoate/2-iminopropanoate deaminase
LEQEPNSDDRAPMREAEMKKHNWMPMLFARLGPVLSMGVLLHAAEVKPVVPPGAQIVGPYTPALQVGTLLYVSGQGALDAGGKLAPTLTEQMRQSLNNVKSIVEAAGLTMEHLVYSQVYVTDPSAYDVLSSLWKEFFKEGGPALSLLGVAALPVGTPVEINAVAVTDAGLKRAIRLPGGGDAAAPPDAVIAGDRLFFSSCLGLEPDGRVPADSTTQTRLALDRMEAVLRAAGIGPDHVVFVNPYITDALDARQMNREYARHFKFGDTPARATIHVVNLPRGAAVSFTGVAAIDLASRRSVRPKNMPPSPTASPCVFVADTLYCSAKSAFIPGPNLGVYAESVENQVRQTVRNLLDGLEEAGMSLGDVVATNVYLDDIRDFAAMNRIYASYFKAPFPTRTTVQQRPPVERKQNEREQWPDLEEISLVAVKQQNQ